MEDDSKPINGSVWRADRMSPGDIKRQGGIFPKGMDGTRPNQKSVDLNLLSHINGSKTGMSTYHSGYVSTSSSKMSAFKFMVMLMNGDGYLYEIRATPNFIDAAGSLRHFYGKSDEKEYSAAGGVKWEQIKGWIEVSFSTQGKYKKNRDYNAKLYERFSAGVAAPHLAGFPENHPAWSMSPWKDDV